MPVFPALVRYLAVPALFIWCMACADAQTQDTTLAQTLLEESREHNKLGEYAAAAEKARSALDILTSVYGADHVRTARAGLFLGLSLRNNYRIPEATARFRQSLQVFEAARDTFQMALCYHHIGLCLRNQRQYREARAHIQTAIDLLQPLADRYQSYILDFTFSLSTVLLSSKNYLDAIPLLEKSNDWNHAHGNKRYLGFTHYRLGEAYFGVHDYERAKEQFLAAADDLKDILPPEHLYFADLKTKLGQCCQQSGEPETGLAYLLQARDHYRQYNPGSPHLYRLLNETGAFYLEEQRYAAAEAALTECLKLVEEWFGSNSHYLLNTLALLGSVQTRSGQWDRAETTLQHGLRIALDSLVEKNEITGRLYTLLADLRLAQGDFPGCRIYCDSAMVAMGFDSALPERAVPRDRFREICALFGMTYFGQFRQQGDLNSLEQAEQYFALAAATLFLEVEEITVNSSKALFYDRDHQVLDHWLESRLALYAATGDPAHAEAAFRISGHSKAFLLSEAMQRSGALRFAGVPDSMLQEETSLRALIVEAEKDIDAAEGDIDSLALERSQDLAAWRRNYDDLLERIGQDYPDYYQLRKLREPVPAAAMQEWLAPGQGMLMFGLTDSMTCLFVLTRDTFFVRTIPLGEAGLDAMIEPFRRSFTDYFTAANPDDARYDSSLEEYTTLASSLYQTLLQPVAALLPERLVIVPEGKLYFLPFEALLTGAPRDPGNFRSYPFWMRDKAIAYGLSTNYLLRSAEPPPLKAEREWLGIAPFDDNGTTSGVFRADSLEPLPNSGREVLAIANLVGGEAWLGTAAAEGRFLREAHRYRTLHLATHSRADDRQGDYSWLQVAATGKPLPAKDLYQCTLAAEMVVLSACEAGGGRLLRGEGIIGIVRALTYAGARSIVASMWLANDQGTADMMVEFYRQLQQGKTRDQALRAARLHLIDQSPAEAHPFFWAGFRVYGG